MFTAPTSDAMKIMNDDDTDDPDYMEYVKRLQDRIAEFSNVKDSIDLRKSKRRERGSKGSSNHSRTAEMIANEIKASEDSLNNGVNSPATSRKLEEIMRERSKQKTVIHDLLMDKLEAQKQKSAEKKAKRAARTASFSTLPGSVTPNKIFPEIISTPPNSPANGHVEKREGQS